MNRAAFIQFLSGAITMGYLVAGLLFWRFWSKTRDTLFRTFAVAFWLLGIQRCFLAADTRAAEDQIEHYLIRLLGYLLILVAFYQKNRKRYPSTTRTSRT